MDTKVGHKLETSTVGRATTENSAILRGIERRKAERAAMQSALAQASEFSLLVESFMFLPADPKRGDGPPKPAESEVLNAGRELRAAIAKVTGSKK